MMIKNSNFVALRPYLHPEVYKGQEAEKKLLQEESFELYC